MCDYCVWALNEKLLRRMILNGNLLRMLQFKENF